MLDLLRTIKIVLSNLKYTALSLGIILIFLATFVLIPVLTVPGNDLAFQISIYKVTDVGLMVALAGLISLTFTLQIYAWRENRKCCSVPKSLTQGVGTGISGMFAAILGSAFCASCLVSLFAAIGLGSGAVFFVLENQPYFLTAAILLMLVSLYFALRKAKLVAETIKK